MSRSAGHDDIVSDFFVPTPLKLRPYGAMDYYYYYYLFCTDNSMTCLSSTLKIITVGNVKNDLSATWHQIRSVTAENKRQIIKVHYWGLLSWITR